VSRSEGRGVGSRQAATQHLEVLKEAKLVTTSRRGREKHYLNSRAALRNLRAVIATFARSRLKALREMKKRLAGGNR
jgi:DNA-binding transcriptional ArsR family regulator